MTEDILRELHRLQQYAAGLQGLLVDAQAQSPERAEASDSTGAVRVVLGPDGLPASIEVDADWQRRLEPSAFGGAVVEAFNVAAGSRMASWTTALEQTGWRSAADELRDGIDRPATDRPAMPVAGADGGPPAAQPAPRALESVAEDVLKAFEMVEQYSNPPSYTAKGSGSAAEGKLTVVLTPAGLASCTANSTWLSQQSGAELTDALSRALAAAKHELGHTVQAPNPAAHLNRLYDEAMAILADPRRLTES